MNNINSEEERFQFGENWNGFLDCINEERVKEATRSIKEIYSLETLAGKTFLDIGSGSGLFSLAARKLGATVYSFDYDDKSVSCTRALKAKYFSNDKNWTVEQGSVLDNEYLEGLGLFDYVYSWGVLHHTGNMNVAIANAIRCVAPNGEICIALYNDQGLRSRIWKCIKKLYCKNMLYRGLIIAVFFPLFALINVTIDLVNLRAPFSFVADYKKKRGMSVYYDWFDWLGGYPFEVANPNWVVDMFSRCGFLLSKIRLTAGWGCNQYAFVKADRSRRG